MRKGDFAITFEEFMKWYKDSMLFEHQMKLNAEQLAGGGEEEGGEGEEPISLAFPDTTGARIMYLITFPIMIGVILIQGLIINIFLIPIIFKRYEFKRLSQF